MNSALLDFLGDKPFEEVKALMEAEPFNVEVKEDPDFPAYYLLKYNQIKSDFYNPIVRECRGSILTKGTNQFVCRPFDKFGNYGEGYVPELDMSTAHAEEKIDGSLIKVWYADHYGRWMVSTNGTIDAEKAEIQNDLSPVPNFLELFLDCFETEQFKYLNKEYTHMFEVVSPWNKVVVHYPESDIYYLSSRNNYYGNYEVHGLSNVRIPLTYAMNNLDQVIKMAQDLPFNNEGYVVVDGNDNRVKVKSPAYVAVHHLKNNGVITKKRLVDLILLGEDAEFINYFPEYADAMNDIRDKYIIFMEELDNDVSECKIKRQFIDMTKDARKEFAIWATQTIFPGLMFSLLDYKIDINNWKEYINNMDSEKLLKYLLVVKI